MTVEEATAYHQPQLRALAEAGADIATGLTMTTIDEAVGLALAAQSAGIPVVVSFTVETDGRLPSGEPLGEAIGIVDDATVVLETDNHLVAFVVTQHAGVDENTGQLVTDGLVQQGCDHAGINTAAHGNADRAG